MRGPRRATRTRAARRDDRPRMRSLRDRHSRSAITSRRPHRDECGHHRNPSQERRKGEDAPPGVDPESCLSDRGFAVSVAIAPRAAIARPRPVPRRRSIPFPSLVGRDSQPRPVRKVRSTLEARYISERCSTPARAPCLAASAVPPDPASVARRDHWRDRAAHRPPHARRRSSVRSPPRTVPARTPRSLGARRRPHATRHRPPARRPRDAKHRTPAPADDQGPPARSPTPGLNTASVPNSTGRAVREELGAQTHPPGLTNQRAIGIIRPRRLAPPIRIPTALPAKPISRLPRGT